MAKGGAGSRRYSWSDWVSTGTLTSGWYRGRHTGITLEEEIVCIQTFDNASEKGKVDLDGLKSAAAQHGRGRYEATPTHLQYCES